jgi:hypothetical protein
MLAAFGVIMVTGNIGRLSNFFFELLSAIGLESLTTS